MKRRLLTHRWLTVRVLWLVVLTLVAQPVSAALVYSPAAIPGHAVGQATPPEEISISYAAAADWLADLPAEDHDDQILDWAILGLAGLLELDVGTLRDAIYDQTPVRDALFWDITTNRNGPGRGLPDGASTLHVLIPRDDPHEARTVAMVLDDYRKDAVVEMARVILYRYSIDRVSQEVVLTPEPAQATSSVRERYGYVESSISSLAELQDFLLHTRHLAEVGLRDGEIFAGGWHWPEDVPVGSVTVEDITVLQRGYRSAQGHKVSVAEFLTEVDLSRLDVALSIPAALAARAEELDTFLSGLIETEGGEDNVDLERLIDLLTTHQQLVFDVILDADAVRRLENDRESLSSDEWLLAYAEALFAALDGGDIWSTLLYVAGGKLRLPDLGATEPGFSLDPGSRMSLDALLELIVPSVYPALAGHEAQTKEFVEAWDWLHASDDSDPVEFFKQYGDFIAEFVLTEAEAEEARRLLADFTRGPVRLAQEAEDSFVAYYQLVVDAVSDPLRPWPLLLNAAEGDPPYQVARYEGDLQGSEVGMTYFYTDLVAKAWLLKVGDGSPEGTVPGFVPKPNLATPWGHCTRETEQGRLWFGLREEAISLNQEYAHFGSLVTRVFTLVNAPQGDVEIEPSYGFGYGIRWWDRHYLPLADYEPQYHRLDQLMRWGAAIAWLLNRDAALPELTSDSIPYGLHFADWLSMHPELRWRFAVPFVEPPGESTEALLRLFSRSYADCGANWFLSGGISGPSMAQTDEIERAHPNLPASLDRGALGNLGTQYSDRDGSGVIANLDGTVKRTLFPLQDTTAQVEVVANGSKVLSLRARPQRKPWNRSSWWRVASYGHGIK